MRELLTRLRDWLHRDTLDRELQEELAFHRAQTERDLEGVEVPIERTKLVAMRVGNTTRIREAARERWSWPALDQIMQDARYAARGMRRNTGFTVVVVVLLSLGLGANLSVFSLLDRMYVRPPEGVLAPGQLRRAYVHQYFNNGNDEFRTRFNYPETVDIKAGLQDVQVGVYVPDSAVLGSNRSARPLRVQFTDDAYWKVLGVRVVAGRTFDSVEARIDIPARVAIISHRLWQTEFGGRADVVGQHLALAEKMYAVVGVAPPAFNGVDMGANDVWMPLGAMPMSQGMPGVWWYQIRGDARLHLVARMADETSLELINQRTTKRFREGSVAAGYEKDSLAVLTFAALNVARGPMQQDRAGAIATRLGAVCLAVLIIACANVANLLLVRAFERRREIAVRLALGVGITRLAFQFLIETLMLVGLAAVISLLVAVWSASALQRWIIPDVRFDALPIDGRLVLLALGVVVGISLSVSMVPLLFVRKQRGSDVLRSGNRVANHSGAVRNSLIVLQTALAVVLLVGAALSVRSLQQVLQIDIGMDADRLAYARPVLLNDRGGGSSERSAELQPALTTVAAELSANAAVEHVSLATQTPFGGYTMVPVRVSVLDTEPKLNGFGPATRWVDGNYWSTVGMRPTQGRVFSASDVNSSGLVIVINETMADHVWKTRSPVGDCVYIFRNGPCRTIIGVVPNVRTGRVIEEASMQMYIPLSQGSRTGSTISPTAIVVRARRGQVEAAQIALNRSIEREFSNAYSGVQVLAERVELQYRPWQLGAVLFSTMGLLGTLVAAIGLYGVLAYGVRQRMQEMGIRIALGAQSSDMIRLVTLRGFAITTIGIVAGIAIAFQAARFIEPVLYLQPSRDFAIYGMVSIAMLLAGLLATLIPARKAASVDPMISLRSE